ncbi:arginase [Opitutaceae bacterium EW11]|nr:arginase [Opitutaceae bacterium EW11]
MKVDLIEARTNLGLRPDDRGKLPGTRAASRVLLDAGLARTWAVRRHLVLDAPAYDREPQRETRIRNGQSIRTYGMQLCEAVREALNAGAFPVVLGGDCSNLMGCLAGLRQAGGRGLVHLDGHGDFLHPGNYDTASRLGSAAGMDLALATGRGEPLLTLWPGVVGPLVEDADVVQLGEREREAYAEVYREMIESPMYQRTVQEILAAGVPAALEQVLVRLDERGLERAWLHLDLDVLDAAVMGAVDSPGSPGLDFAGWQALVSGLLASGRIAGATIAIYDPDLDPGHHCAPQIVEAIESCLGRWLES